MSIIGSLYKNVNKDSMYFKQFFLILRVSEEDKDYFDVLKNDGTIEVLHKNAFLEDSRIEYMKLIKE